MHSRGRIVDAWMQHPSRQFLAHPMFPKYPNVYIDTSAYKVSRYPRELVEYLRAHGRRKVLFGSNHPAWPPAMCLEDFESLQLDPEVEELFLYRNAERVFGLAG